MTSQLNQRHELTAFYHYDRMQYTSHQNNDADPIVFQSGGGSVYSSRLNSVWNKRIRFWPPVRLSLAPIVWTTP